MNIVVLAGGVSAERDVSLKSGEMIAGALREAGQNAVLVDSFLGIDELPKDLNEFFLSPDQKSGFEIAEKAPDINEIKKDGAPDIGKNVIEICKAADVVFMGLHGADGENGKMQALFDLSGIKYTGSGSFGSSLAMHKDVAKQLCGAWNINSPAGRMIDGSAGSGDRLAGADAYGFPCVVKPCTGGSSIGVTIAKTRSELEDALREILNRGEEAIVEKYIEGREFSVGILGKNALPPIEIIPKDGFYDYEHKYQPGLTEELCPAPIDNRLTSRIKSMALLAFYALHLEVYGRAEFILTNDNKLYFIEMNTLPGMTPVSLLPQEAAAAGMSYEDLCMKIVELSLNKYKSII